MTPTKLLIGQIFMVFAIVIAGLWGATQWCASMLGYQPELGLPWFMLGELPIYRPWSIFWWWYSYEAYAPEVFDKAGTLAGASGFLGCAAAIGGSLWRARQARHVTTYGSARWATPGEIERAGLRRAARCARGGRLSYVRAPERWIRPLLGSELFGPTRRWDQHVRCVPQPHPRSFERRPARRGLRAYMRTPHRRLRPLLGTER